MVYIFFSIAFTHQNNNVDLQSTHTVTSIRVIPSGFSSRKKRWCTIYYIIHILLGLDWTGPGMPSRTNTGPDLLCSTVFHF